VQRSAPHGHAGIGLPAKTIPATVHTLINEAHARLKRARLSYGHGTTNAWDEAVYLVTHALKLPLDNLAPLLARPVSNVQYRRAHTLIEARIRSRLPAAYLTREAWLDGYRFYIDERVIVPRSYIAELLRARLAPWITQPRTIRRALDMCTGSGCLAIIMAKTFQKARIDASDISSAALAVARRNVAVYRLQQRINLVKSNMFLTLKAKRYDLIIANPPYVSAAVMRRLPLEYRHEPPLALAGGSDGFDAVRTLLRGAAAHLTAKGVLVVEIGHHRRRLEAEFPQVPFVWLETAGGDDCVFMLSRGDLEVVAPARAKLRPPATQPGAASRRHPTRAYARASRAAAVPRFRSARASNG
jgi:ribosomal protein L3 glutamine methyltransferase